MIQTKRAQLIFSPSRYFDNRFFRKLVFVFAAVPLSLAAAISAGEPDPVGAPGAGQVGRISNQIDVRDLGVQLLAQPVDLGGGIRFLGTGPSPGELYARIVCNRNAADTTNADQLWTGGGLGLNLSGAGLTAGVWDEGAVRTTHQELAGRVTSVDGGANSSHSTHVAGTIGATGITASAHGMATGILIRSRNWTNDVSEINADAAANLIQISNHSYGFVNGWTTGLDWGIGFTDTWYADRALYATESPNFGKYDSSVRSLDTTLTNRPYHLCCWSAGNDRTEGYSGAHGDNTYVAFFSTPPVGGTSVGGGYYQVPNSGATSAPPSDGNGGTGYDCISGLGLAKNNVTVGGINDQTLDPYSSVSIYTSGGNGPVDDGRVKPDVVGNGIGLNSCTATSNTSYSSFTGTSMSSPNVAGTAALLIEEYKSLNSGVLPLAATSKALLIHSAFDGGLTGPDYRYGWGLPDAVKAVVFMIDSESASPSSNFLYEASYAGTTQDYVFTYSGFGDIKATMVWTDPAPALGAMPPAGLDTNTPVLVRDLDLSIIGPGPTTYWPWTLDPVNPTTAAVRTVRNAVDNVEQVLINSPGAGTYTVRVSHTGTVTSQNYSLLISNVSAGAPPIINPVADAAICCGSTYTSSAPSLSQGTSPITWTLDVGPPLMTIDSGTGVVSWPIPVASASPYTVTIRATNGLGFDTETWQLTVAPGDFNCDGVLNDLDIPDFVDHLLEVLATRPCAADMNVDTFIDGLDAQPFVDGM